MKQIIHLALRTGFSFRAVYGHLEKTISYNQKGFIGVADIGNTFSHYELEITSGKNEKINPIYGVRLGVVKNATEEIKPRGQF